MSLAIEQSLDAKVGAIAEQACQQLFQAYGVDLKPTSEPWGAVGERQLCGIIGFVGRRLRGTCVLAGSEAPIIASCPASGGTRDWVGELANQLAGRLKAKFLALGVEVHLTTPVVLSGMRLEPLPTRNHERRLFATDDGQVMVWIEVDSPEGIVLGSEHPFPHGGEGDILLF